MIFAFQTQYEELVGLLCSAAREGVHEGAETHYRRLRSSMQAHYRALQPLLRPHAPADSAPDVFQELLAAPSLDQAIALPGMVGLLEETRADIERCRSQLGAE